MTTVAAPKKKLDIVPSNPYGVDIRHRWNFSPSQLSLWNVCRRKFGFKYVDKIQGQNKYAARGDAVHKYQEEWLIHGTPPDEETREGRLARSGLKFLPLPKIADPRRLDFPRALVERPFIFVSRQGYKYRGNIDLSYRDSPDSTPVLLDHKTTTDFKWALTETTLREDTQALIYSAESIFFWKSQVLDLRWLYYKDDAKRPKAKCVEASQMWLTEVESKFPAIDAIAEQIATIGLVASRAKDLEANPLACEQYGGCPYKQICGLSDGERLAAFMTQSSIRERLQAGAGIATAANNAPEKPMSALERMRAKAGTAPQGAPAQSLAPAAGQVPRTLPQPAAQAARPVQQPATQAAPSGGSLIDRMKARNLAAKMVPAEVPAVAQTSTPDPWGLTPEGQRQQAVVAGHTVINESNVNHAMFTPTDVNPPERPQTPLDEPAQVAELNAKPKADEPEKKRRGRPAGAISAAKVSSGAFSDEGFIYGHVFSEVLRETRGDFEQATELAKKALEGFRSMQAVQ